MGAAAVILITAGFTVYTLVNPTAGIVLWAAALCVALAAVKMRLAARRSPT